MRNRRLAIIAGLGVVELWIVGLMLRSVAGGHDAGALITSAQIGSASPAPARDGGARTIETGSAPDVVIDDEGATLTVTALTGASVAVRNRSEHGWFDHHEAPLRIEKTSGGVQILRAPGDAGIMFGSPRRELDVVVPPQARLEVRNAGAMVVSGLRADAVLHSDDGSVRVRDNRGDLRVSTDNGRIELSDVEASYVEAGSDDGRITFDRVRADRVAVSTDNGRIEVQRSRLRGGKIQTDNGRVTLGLDPHSDVLISAKTESGKISAASPLIVTGSGEEDDAPATIRVGSGSGALDVASSDGSISIRSGGM